MHGQRRSWHRLYAWIAFAGRESKWVSKLAKEVDAINEVCEKIIIRITHS